MSRVDHCFLLRASAGWGAMAFCEAERFDRDAARSQVDEALGRLAPDDSFELAYLGQLDYREMDPLAGQLVEPFLKLGPVWLARFCRQDEGPGSEDR